jgi:flagellar M-ring protein FliF
MAMSAQITSGSPSIIAALRQMPAARRFTVLAVLAAVLAILTTVALWMRQPEFVPLLRGVELGAVGQVTEQLAKAGIPYRLADGGSRIEVPAAQVARARVSLAQANLPGDGRPGMELFDRPSWGMTDFTQRVTYRRALEGELSRTIKSVKGVLRAQVHLTLPESSPLRRLERPAQAAVVLTLSPGTILSPEAVRGIAYIVSNSVEQLSVERVAVMDDSGHLLSVPADDQSPAGVSARHLELQRAVEAHIQQKLETLLAAAVGSGAAKVQVSATLNFEQVDRTTEAFDPEGQVLQSEQRSEGEPGPNGSAQTVVANTYQNTRRIEKIIGQVGNVKRLTVAVLLDEAALGRGDSGAARRTALEQAVRSAAGIDDVRGDQLSVIPIAFERAPLPVADSLSADPSKVPTTLEAVERFSRPTVALFAVLAALILGWRALRPLPAATPPVAPPQVPAVAAGPALPEPQEAVRLHGHTQPEALVSAETAAQVVRAWLSDAR